MEVLVFKNAFYQLLARGVNAASTLLITIVVARSFGVFGYGEFTKVIAFVGLFYLLVDFGLNATFLQKRPAFPFATLLWLRLGMAFVLMLVANGIAYLLPFSESFDLGFGPLVKLGILIFSLTLFTQAVQLSCTAVFQRMLRFDLSMAAALAGSLVTLVFVAVASLTLSFPLLFFSFLVGAAVSSALCLFWVGERRTPLSPRPHLARGVLLESAPLALMLFFNLIYFRADLILLSLLRSTGEVGLYGFAYKFFDLFIAIPLFLSNALFPFLQKAKEKKAIFKSITYRFALIFLAASLVITLLAFLLAPLLALVREDFVASVVPLRILVLSLPIFFLTSLFQWVLITAQQKSFLVLVYATSSLANVMLNLAFIPRYSYLASSVITGVSEGMVLLLLAWRVYLLFRNHHGR